MFVKKKVILPFENPPYSLMYHFHAIIQGNAREDIMPWLCGKFMNCSFDKNPKVINRFINCSSDLWNANDSILLKQRFRYKFNFVS